MNDVRYQVTEAKVLVEVTKGKRTNTFAVRSHQHVSKPTTRLIPFMEWCREIKLISEEEWISKKRVGPKAYPPLPKDFSWNSQSKQTPYFVSRSGDEDGMKWIEYIHEGQGSPQEVNLWNM